MLVSTVDHYNHHGGGGYGTRNQKGKRILSLCAAPDLSVTNTFFRKRISQIIKYHLGGCTMHVDYILVKRTDLKLVKNTTLIRIEKCFL